MQNTGLGIGIIHYINFPMKQNATVIPDTYFNDHFKLRSELSYNKTDLEHFGVGSPSVLVLAQSNCGQWKHSRY
jgi:hypothetical protein